MKNYVKAGYVVSGYLDKISESDARRLNVINIAFGHCVNSEAVFDCGCADIITRIRSYNPDIKILLSIGGWGAGGFSPMAATAENRAKFALSAADIMAGAKLDGIDIDWEYPCIDSAGIEASPDDRHNYTLVLEELRKAVDAVPTPSGCRPMLTIAVGAGEYFIENTEMDKVAAIVDYVSLMTYDMRGSWSGVTGHHTNLLKPANGVSDPASIEHSVDIYVSAGVPLEKIVIGAAFYSRKWEGVCDKNGGYLQQSKGTGGFGPSYADIVENYLNKYGYVYHWDETAMAPWLFNGDTFLTFDDPRSVAAKCGYIKRRGLLGIMYWEHSCDPTGILLGVIDRNL